MALPLGLCASRRLLAACFSLAAAAAQGAEGFTITQGDENRVSVGMSEADVRQSLGPPARIHQFRNKPGPSWTYAVQAAPFGRTDFDIDFDAGGKVVTATERLYGSSH